MVITVGLLIEIKKDHSRAMKRDKKQVIFNHRYLVARDFFASLLPLHFNALVILILAFRVISTRPAVVDRLSRTT